METTKDPVCGKMIDKQQAAGSSRSGGQVYYFCSATCREQFEHNPEHYIDKTFKSKTS